MAKTLNPCDHARKTKLAPACRRRSLAGSYSDKRMTRMDPRTIVLNTGEDLHLVMPGNDHHFARKHHCRDGSTLNISIVELNWIGKDWRPIRISGYSQWAFVIRKHDVISARRRCSRPVT